MPVRFVSPSDERPTSLGGVLVCDDARGWRRGEQQVHHHCRTCGLETEPGWLACFTGPFGTNDVWPICPRSGCNAEGAAIELVVD